MVALITIILVAFVLALSIMLRSVDVFRFYAYGGDTFANLLYSKWLKGGSRNLYKIGKIVWPPLLPRLLYHLPLRLRARALIPKIFDVLTSVTVFLFTLWSTGDKFIAFLALLFYTASPINIATGWGISSRNIGSFFLAFTLLASYVAIFDANVRYILLLLAIVSGVLMMFTSRIAYKSYYILAVATIILWQVEILFAVVLLIAILSFVLCLLITRGGFINDLKGHIFLINFFRNRRVKKGSIVKRIVIIFKYDLWWVVGVLAFISGTSALSLNDTNLFLSTWLFTMIALSFLWPWGEGERHIMFGTAPASILAASYLSKHPLMIIPLLILETYNIIKRMLSLLKGKNPVSVDESMLKLFKIMKETIGDSLILCLPPYYSFPVAYFTEKKVLYGEMSSEEGILFQAEVLDSIHTEENLEELVTKYSVTHLFVDKDQFPLSISPNRWDPILQEEKIVVLRRKDQQKS